jgi:DNA-binding IclR family transcriptional regulator
VLECFLGAEELGATAVAREVGIAKSTASRMLAMLASRGLVPGV